jgi:tetratricopeptide (TPR) repeat protein
MSGSGKDPVGTTVNIGHGTASGDSALVRVDVAQGSDPRRNKLPNYTGHPAFIGRTEDLAAIGRILHDPEQAEVLVLHGTPGVGKTRIAVEYALRNWDGYPGGVFFVQLDLARPTELADLLDVFGLKRDADEGLDEQCRRALARLGVRPTLLIYDNVPDDRVLSAWLPTGGRAYHVLATSTFAYWPLSWKVHAVALLPDEDASALVNQVVRNRTAALRWVEPLVRKARGITVELCAAAKAVDYQTRRGRRGALDETLAGETVSSFGGAWRILTEDARLVLQSAVLFETTRIPPEALHALWIGEGWSPARLDAALDAALDRTLVVSKGEAFEVHQCVARFVREQREPAIPETVRERHFDGFIEAARCFFQDPANPQLGAWLRAYPTNVAFWDVVFPGNSTALDDGAHTLGDGLRMDGRFDEARPWFERAVKSKHKGEMYRRIDHASLGRSLHQVGYCLSSVGRFDDALPWFFRAVKSKQKGDVHNRVDHKSLGSSLHVVGHCLSSVGRFDEALPWFERAVKTKQKGDVHGRVDHASLGRSLQQVGSCLASAGRFDEAFPWFERAVKAAQAGDVHSRVDHESLGSSLQQVGSYLASAGRFDEALQWFKRAVEAKEQGDVHSRVDHESLGSSLHQVGSCHASVRQFEEALPWFKRAVEAAQKGDVHGRVDHASLGRSHHQVGSCLASAGQFKEALPWFEHAVEAGRKGDVFGRVDDAVLRSCPHQDGSCLASAGRFDEALPWFERAVDAAQNSDVHGRVDHASLEMALRALSILDDRVRSKK